MFFHIVIQNILKYALSLTLIFVSLIVLVSCCDTVTIDSRQTSQSSIIYNNRELHYYISTPNDFDSSKSYPLLIVLHGGTRVDSSTAFWILENLYVPALYETNLLIVAPNSPSNFGWDKIEGIESIKEIINDTKQHYLIDANSYIVSGYSMGAIMAWHVLEQLPQQFIGAISVSGRYGWDSIPYLFDDQNDNPYLNSDIDILLRKYFYVINSRIDDQFPFIEVEWQMNKLIELGVSIQFNPVDDVLHVPASGFIQTLQNSIPWINSLLTSY